MEERVQKIIADYGYCSRREAEEFLKLGLIKINGKIAKPGDKADPEESKIQVDGVTLKNKNAEKVFLLINKPRGCASSLKDMKARKDLSDFINKKELPSTLFVVGHLEFNAEGLLIITNDRRFYTADIEMTGVLERKYSVKIWKPLDEKLTARIEKGLKVNIKGEYWKSPKCKLEVKKQLENQTWIDITIAERRSRMISELFVNVSHPVSKIECVEIGGIKIGRLKSGGSRLLKSWEIENLHTALGIEMRK